MINPQQPVTVLSPTNSAPSDHHSKLDQYAAVRQYQQLQRLSTTQNVQQAADAAQDSSSDGTKAGSEVSTSKPGSLLNLSGRFYDTVTIAPYNPAQLQQQETSGQTHSSPTGFKLLLRKYPVKTPSQNLLVLPTYSLALAVAAEWEWLPKGKPIPHMMPLTSLAATATDQPRDRQKVIEHLLKYVHTDGACIRYAFIKVRRCTHSFTVAGALVVP